MVRHLRESGLNGQYLDMIGNSTMAGRCYNPRHVHPKGGGSFGPDGYRVLLQRLKRENPDFPLTTEGANSCSTARCFRRPDSPVRPPLSTI